MKIKLVFCFAATLLFAVIANGQKLPNVQKVSLRAPADIKVDGRLTEWKDTLLQAENSANRFNYVVCNDDTNLYFTMKAQDRSTSGKFMSGGTIITISRSGGKKIKENNADNVVITFPIEQSQEKILNIQAPMRGSREIYNEPEKNAKKIDSVEAVVNQRLDAALKLIAITGIKEITDSVLSVYNQVGIKTGIKYNAMQIVYELAIPLKYLGITAQSQAKISYNIKLMGENLEEMGFGGGAPNPSIAPPVIIGGQAAPPSAGQRSASFMFSHYPTDLSGEYTLAKQPN